MASDKNRLQEFCQKKKINFPIYETYCTNDTQIKWKTIISMTINGLLIKISPEESFNTKAESEKNAAREMIQHIKTFSSQSHYSPNSETKQSHIIPSQCATKKYTISDNTNNTIDTNKQQDTLKQLDFSKKCVIENIHDHYFTKIYIIDLENKPQLNLVPRQDSIYLGFINSLHHSVGKYSDWYNCTNDNIAEQISTSGNNKLLYCIDGGISDLSDHFMTAFIYPIINYISSHIINKFENTNTSICIISGDHAGYCTRYCLEKMIRWNKLSNIDVSNSIIVD